MKICQSSEHYVQNQNKENSVTFSVDDPIKKRSRVEQLVAKADISKQEIQEILACISRILANKKCKKPRNIPAT